MEYTLNCLVLGAEDTFPVKIMEAQSVGELKDEIKKKKPNDFNGVDADRLTLYKINVDLSNPVEYENIMREVSQPSHVFNPKLRLLAAWRISTHFGESSDRLEGNIHILVELPRSKSMDP